MKEGSMHGGDDKRGGLEYFKVCTEKYVAQNGTG